MAKIRAQVVLDRAGGLPEDVIVNTFHFEDDSGFATDGGISVNGPGLLTRLDAFYDALAPAVLSSVLLGTGTIKLYDMADTSAPGAPRIPRLEGPITFTRPTNPGLPSECAVVLSMEAAREAGTNPRRRRGRIYLGPLNGGIIQVNPSGSDWTIVPARTVTIVNAAKTMARGGSGAFRLAVFSPTEAAGNDTLDSAWNDVEFLSCDNAIDIQRKRGAEATTRTRLAIEGAAAPVTGAA